MSENSDSGNSRHFPTTNCSNLIEFVRKFDFISEIDVENYFHRQIHELEFLRLYRYLAEIIRDLDEICTSEVEGRRFIDIFAVLAV